jgi:serine/threonine protein kinase
VTDGEGATNLPYDNFGAYRVTSVLGRGGFATVYACTDDRLEDDVAVKVLADNYATDPEVRSRFISEGRLIRKIDNQHLIRVHDVGETERGQPFLVLELADRGDLAGRVAELRATGWEPSPADVRKVAEAVLDAAAALHNNQLVHRDIKPDNVLIRSTNQARLDPGVAALRDDERLLLSDLGFAKDLALNSGFTVSGGTARFSAPEQLAGNLVTPQADLYAAAKLLQWFTMAPNGTPEAPWIGRLHQVLAPALATDPAARPASAEALLGHIRAALADADAAPPQPPPPSPARPTPARPTSAHPDRPGAVRATPVPPDSETAPVSPAPAPARPASRTRQLVAALTIAAVVIGGAVLAALVLRDGGDDNVNRANPTQEATRVTVIVDGRPNIEIRGPLQVATGEVATLTATAPDGSTFLWTMPNGDEISAESVDITTLSAGSTEVELRVELPTGDISDLTYPLEITDP